VRAEDAGDVENSHKDHEIELFLKISHIPDRQASEFDICAFYLRSEASLAKIMFVRINPKHARGPPAFHLKRVEPGVAADVQNGLARRALRNCIAKRFELYTRIVAEKVFRRRLDAPRRMLWNQGPRAAIRFSITFSFSMVAVKALAI
jgi:hypothetical protein